MNRPPQATSTRETQIVRTFVDLADTLVADFDIIDSLTVLVDRCVEILDAAGVGILLADTDGRLHVIAASNEEARLLELFQLQNDEGPCLEAFASGQPVIHTDLATSTERWPKFTPYAIGAGYDSVHTIPLRLRGTIIGALNLFRSDPGVLADDDIDMAAAFDPIRARSRNTNTNTNTNTKLTDVATQIVHGRVDLAALTADRSHQN